MHRVIWSVTACFVLATAAQGNDRIRGDLAAILAEAAPDDFVPITIVMKEQVPRADLDRAAGFGNKAARRQAVSGLLKQTAAAAQAELVAMLRLGGTRDLRSLWLHNVVIVEAVPDVIHAAANRADVAYVQHDRPVAVEDVLAMSAAGSFDCGVEIMGAPDVWNDLGITGEGVVVGVIDSGCCITHPDLANQVWNNADEIPGNGVDDDSNGFIDDTYGWDFGQNDNTPNDSQNHGTPVSGHVCGDGTKTR